MGQTNYFLLTYDLGTRTAQIREFGADDRAAAAAYTELELQYRDREDIEVVLIGGDSLETVKKTHSHYFTATTDELFDEFARRLALA